MRRAANLGVVCHTEIAINKESIDIMKQLKRLIFREVKVLKTA